MALVANVASSSRRRPPKQSRSDVFRPRFPLDPHAALSLSGREPWFLKPERLPSLAVQPRRDVFLVLGAPSTHELSPILHSKHLANSLLIIATHVPPEIPHTTLPTVRILKLNSPLAIEDAGAVRFVNVLEWAERVARLWRRHGGFGAVELAEEGDDGQAYLTPPTLFQFGSYPGSQSTPVSPRSSTSALSTKTSGSRPRSVSARLLTMARPRQSMMPPVDPTQRPFDGLLNFLPGNTSDKALLKQSILVTTISRPFLVAADARPATATLRTKRRSLFSSQSTTSVYLPPTPPSSSGDSLPLHSQSYSCPGKAHLLHLLPAETHAFTALARSRLVHSLEAFLLSFAYEGGMNNNASMSVSGDGSMERARPYIMQASILGEVIVTGADIRVNDGHTEETATDTGETTSNSNSNSPYGPWTPECTLADLVLSGALNPYEPPSSPASGKNGMSPFDRLTPRAWISGPSDIILVSDDAAANSKLLHSQGPSVVVTPPPEVSSAKSNSAPGSLGRSATQRVSSTKGSRRSSIGSPLVPKRRHNSLGANGGGGSKMGSRYHGRNELPTPPDSEESGSEIPSGVVTDISEHVESEATNTSNSSRTSGEGHTVDTEASSSSRESGGGAGSRRRGKIRWRFWKGSVRSKQSV